MANEYFVNREKTKKCGDHKYDGCFYKVSFTTDREIKLMGLTFYGPAKEDFGTFLVKCKIVKMVEVEEEWPVISDGSGMFKCLVDSCFSVLNYMNIWNIFGPGPYVKEVELFKAGSPAIVPNVRKGEAFTIRFPQPVLVTPHEMTDIMFELVGPDTEAGDMIYGEHQIVLNNMSCVNFNFLRGSSQIPEILFTM